MRSRESGRRARTAPGRRSLTAWLFVLPIAMVHLCIVVIPAVVGLYYSLTDWSGIGSAEFIGLQNFRDLLNDPTFWSALRHNLIWLTFFLTVPFAMALLGASLLARVRRGGLAIRGIFIIPYVLPSIVAAQLWRFLFHPDLGIGGQLGRLGIGGLGTAWLGNPDTALYAIMIGANWTWWGFLTLLLLTAIQSVPVELYDSARSDGASRWQEFRYVTLPGIRPTLMFLLIISAVFAFQGFDFVWILTQGGPAGSSELLSTYIYKRAFVRFDAGYATAIGLTVTIISAIVVSGLAVLRRRGWDE